MPYLEDQSSLRRGTVLFTFVSFKVSNMYLNKQFHKIDRKHTDIQWNETKRR